MRHMFLQTFKQLWPLLSSMSTVRWVWTSRSRQSSLSQLGKHEDWYSLSFQAVSPSLLPGHSLPELMIAGAVSQWWNCPFCRFCWNQGSLVWCPFSGSFTKDLAFFRGFLCGSAGKESTCNVRDQGLIPGLGRSSGEGKGYPLPCSGLKNSMNCIVHGVTKSWTPLSNFHVTCT